MKKEAVQAVAAIEQKLNINSNFALRVPVPTTRFPISDYSFGKQPPARDFTTRISEENKYPQVPQLKAISSYCKKLCDTLVSMQSDNSERRINPPALGKLDSLGHISDFPLVISHENSAFTLHNLPSDHGVPRAWNSIETSRQADPRQIQQRPERREEYFAGETSTSVISDFLAKTLFSKLTDPHQDKKVPNFISRLQP